MAEINCISISHQSAPVQIRSAFALGEEQQRVLFSRLREIGAQQCVVLSTCNRLEVYFDGPESLVQEVEERLCGLCGISRRESLPYFSVYAGEGAIRHLVRVACGIDSMVLGEDEILRQLREAFAFAQESGSTGTSFNVIFKMAVTAAKAIKTDTGLSQTPVSIGTLTSNAAVEFVRAHGGKGTVLIIGITGKIGTITAKNLTAKGGEQVHIIGTTRRHNAEGLFATYPQIEMTDYAQRYALMRRADVVISATKSPHYTVTAAELEKNLSEGGRERLFLDLAVPRDIDPAVGELLGCQVRDIDFFRELSAQNNEKKHDQARSAGQSAEQWVDDIERELVIHELNTELPAIDAVVKKRGFLHLAHSLRKLTDYQGAETIRQWLEDYAAMYGDAARK